MASSAVAKEIRTARFLLVVGGTKSRRTTAAARMHVLLMAVATVYPNKNESRNSPRWKAVKPPTMSGFQKSAETTNDFFREFGRTRAEKRRSGFMVRGLVPR